MSSYRCNSRAAPTRVSGRIARTRGSRERVEIHPRWPGPGQMVGSSVATCSPASPHPVRALPGQESESVLDDPLETCARSRSVRAYAAARSRFPTQRCGPAIDRRVPSASLYHKPLSSELPAQGRCSSALRRISHVFEGLLLDGAAGRTRAADPGNISEPTRAIVLSARASSSGGTITPITLAVLRSTTNWNFVGR